MQVGENKAQKLLEEPWNNLSPGVGDQTRSMFGSRNEKKKKMKWQEVDNQHS